MDYLDIIKEGLGVLLIPILTAVATILVSLLNKAFAEWQRKNEWARLDKYISEAEKAAIEAVQAVFQTMVEGVKGTDEWTEEYTKEVLENAKARTLAGLTQSAKWALMEVYADVDLWLDTKIHSELEELKRRQVSEGE